MTLYPATPATAARSAADLLVVAADPSARGNAPVFWDWAQPAMERVSERLREVDDRSIQRLADALRRDTASHELYRSLQRRLIDLLRAGETSVATLLREAWDSDADSRVGYHSGPSQRQVASGVGPDELQWWLSTRGERRDKRGSAGASILVVIPFRDESIDGRRTRNLIACLMALQDQSLPGDDFDVVVVESDVEPRWEGVISPLCDQYLFAPSSRPFNRSWLLNAGVVNAAGDYELICTLDADVLADRDFLKRAAEHFLQPGRQVLLPYRHMVCMDENSTNEALRQRLLDRRNTADHDDIRAFVIRRPPGLCLFIRRRSWHKVGGMDERYEGWGGEDSDFMLRLSVKAAVDRWDNSILHMCHPPSSESVVAGRTQNSHLQWMTWPSDADYGNLRRFTG